MHILNYIFPNKSRNNVYSSKTFDHEGLIEESTQTICEIVFVKKSMNELSCSSQNSNIDGVMSIYNFGRYLSIDVVKRLINFVWLMLTLHQRIFF